MNNAPHVPKDRFFAMTTLDELRARSQLAKKAGVDVTEISRVAIWGNHSTTQYPDFHHAVISGRPAHETIGDRDWLENDFLSTVQNRGAEVIKARGASSAASAANAAIAASTTSRTTRRRTSTLGRALLERRVRRRPGLGLFVSVADGRWRFAYRRGHRARRLQHRQACGDAYRAAQGAGSG